MSTNATSADPGGSLSVSTDVLTEAFIPAEPPAGRRNAQLRRQLLSADIIAGSFTGAIAALAAGLTFRQLPVVALAIGLGWPVHPTTKRRAGSTPRTPQALRIPVREPHSIPRTVAAQP